MDIKQTSSLQKIANTIRGLSIDAITAAKSGHPGLPLGCAEISAYLYGKALRYNPNNPNWLNRDRFILSAGHGSMLLYSALHLAGYKVSLDDIKNFRQYQAISAGHPEYREMPGVETTTGPLGQGIATAIGMALGQKIAAAKLEVENTDILDAQFYVLAGDGCLMEGISNEACSLAGHLKLDNLVLIYDSNDICLDGPITDCFTEDVAKRYEALGWAVTKIDGHSFDALDNSINEARNRKGKPSLIIAKTTIGKGSSAEGTCDAHGKPLSVEDIQKTKAAFGMPANSFYVPAEVKEYFNSHKTELVKVESDWKNKFKAWQQSNPAQAELANNLITNKSIADIETVLANIEMGDKKATRQLSSSAIQEIAKNIPSILGGSADLSCSDNTFIKGQDFVKSDNYNGQNIKYGVREFAMGAIANGLALHGMFKPFCGTFLTFSDYMRNAIRLAALMKLPVTYQFTHDSIFLGEDGPTHQPVEHVASLRAMPNLTVIRPADANEVKGAWLEAVNSELPVAIILSRHAVTNQATTDMNKTRKGAYVVKEAKDTAIDLCILATGSELGIAMEVATELESNGKSVRVVSFPSFELFEKQENSYKESVLGSNIKKYCSIEALSSMGWHKYIGKDGIAISVDQFGISAPYKNLCEHFGFTVSQIIKRINNAI
jgi:transketolase